MAHKILATAIVLVYMARPLGQEHVHNKQDKEEEVNVARCKPIEAFYGGDFYYLGDRKKWSLALYSCFDDYTMFPENKYSDIYSMCTDDLEWKWHHNDVDNYEGPHLQCLKNAKVLKPDHSFVQMEYDTLLHNDSYKLSCESGYELFREGFLDRDYEMIRNNNGTLEPKVPECVEARCHLKPNSHECLQTNDTKTCRSGTFEIKSGSTVHKSCKDDAQLYRSENGTFVETNVLNASVLCSKGTLSGSFRCLPERHPREFNMTVIFSAATDTQTVDNKLSNLFRRRLNNSFIRLFSSPNHVKSSNEFDILVKYKNSTTMACNLTQIVIDLRDSKEEIKGVNNESTKAMSVMIDKAKINFNSLEPCDLYKAINDKYKDDFYCSVEVEKDGKRLRYTCYHETQPFPYLLAIGLPAALVVVACIIYLCLLKFKRKLEFNAPFYSQSNIGGRFTMQQSMPAWSVPRCLRTWSSETTENDSISSSL